MAADPVLKRQKKKKTKLLHQAIVRGEFTLRSISKLIRLGRDSC